jgi:hypothetical protein
VATPLPLASHPSTTPAEACHPNAKSRDGAGAMAHLNPTIQLDAHPILSGRNAEDAIRIPVTSSPLHAGSTEPSPFIIGVQIVPASDGGAVTMRAPVSPIRNSALELPVRRPVPHFTQHWRKGSTGPFDSVASLQIDAQSIRGERQWRGKFDQARLRTSCRGWA